LAALIAIITVPPVAQLFRFAAPPAIWVAGAFLAGLASVAWVDLLKLRRARPVSEPGKWHQRATDQVDRHQAGMGPRVDTGVVRLPPGDP